MIGFKYGRIGTFTACPVCWLFCHKKELRCERQKVRESMEEQHPEIYPLRNPYAKSVSNHNVAEVTVGR